MINANQDSASNVATVTMLPLTVRPSGNWHLEWYFSLDSIAIAIATMTHISALQFLS